jgi:mRNA interferase YafQ
MRDILRTSQFKKDFKRARSGGRDIGKLVAVIEALQRGESLPRASRDHPLQGDWQSWRECHLAGDWLLVYRMTEHELILGRTGSHSELFE